MSTSIFARNLSAGMTLSPHDLISHEITHLRGRGQSRWRTNPFMASCRLAGTMVFSIVLILYLLDPFLFAIQKTQAINAYLYMTRFGNPAAVQPLLDSGMFTERDQRLLAVRAQLPASEWVKDYFISTADADKVMRDTVAYMTQVQALNSGHMENATPVTKVRYYLFRQFGIIPPREWISLNPVIEAD